MRIRWRGHSEDELAKAQDEALDMSENNNEPTGKLGMISKGKGEPGAGPKRVTDTPGNQEEWHILK